MFTSKVSIEIDPKVNGALPRHLVERWGRREESKLAAPDPVIERRGSSISAHSAKLWLERGLQIGEFLLRAQMRLNRFMNRQ